jgi:3,4-dihydroxy 2-butanone 4-phosphate synthase / GTP cyclohydrolase II
MSWQTATQSVHQAVAALGQGRFALVVDDADRENEGDLVCAAELIQPDQMAFLVRHTTGIVCVPMSAGRADELQLAPMVSNNTESHGTAFTISVDHAATGTGVSAEDRTQTVRSLADPSTAPDDLRRPGHVFPLRARPGGVLRRAGHTEAAVDLTTMAGLSSVAVIAELVDDDGSMRRDDSLRRFATAHGLPIVAIADLVRHRRGTERLVELIATSMMPTEFGEFRAMVYRNVLDGTEHLAMVMGDVVAAGHSNQGALVRVHSECLTGDIVSSLRCDCGTQLEQALQAIAREGVGALVYLRGHEGRGIGLGHKIRAYALQERGLDTIDANIAQGLPVDSRSYGVGAQILNNLGIRRLRLITNNPAKYGGLDGYGLTITRRVSLPTVETPHNVRYLRTKRERMRHDIAVTHAPSQVTAKPSVLLKLGGSQNGESLSD